MTAQEFAIRKVVLGERVRQLQGEVLAMIDETPRLVEKGRLQRSQIYLAIAAGILEEVEMPSLEAMLRLSIQKLQERKRCEQIGGGVPPETENAQSGGIERFPKPTDPSTNGE